MPKKLNDEEKKEWGKKMVAARKARRGIDNEAIPVVNASPTQTPVVTPEPVIVAPSVPPGMAWSVASYFDPVSEVTRLRQVLIPV